jgi:AraC-like DNA-binding protein
MVARPISKQIGFIFIDYCYLVWAPKLFSALSPGYVRTTVAHYVLSNGFSKRCMSYIGTFTMDRALKFYWNESEEEKQTDLYPIEIRPLLIRSSSRTYTVSKKGSMLVQAIAATDFTIWFNHFDILEETDIYAEAVEPLVTMHFLINGDVTGTASNLEGTGLPEGTCHLFYIPAPYAYRINFAKGVYDSVSIDLSVTFLSQMTGFSPEAKRLVQAMSTEQTEGIRYPEGHINFRVRTILDEISGVDAADIGLDMFLHARVYELLWLYLSQLSGNKDNEYIQLYLKRMQQVRDYILLHLDQDLGTSFLSRKFAISATTLKRQFKLQFGLTIRDFIVSSRLDAAKDLLMQTTLSIHSIGAKVGYLEFSSFTRAFTRHHGKPPTHFRKPPP